MSTLSDRIALILQSEPAADAVEAIIAEVRAELRAVERRHADARAVVVDPLAGSAAVAKARKEAEDLSLTRERVARQSRWKQRDNQDEGATACPWREHAVW